MKTYILTLMSQVLTLVMAAQSPQSFQYQAVARDAGGNILTNQNVGVRTSILQGNASGTAVYVETHSPVTNPFGLVNLEIGNGTAVSGSFGDISWGDDLFFLKLEMDVAGGSNYMFMGTIQLQSVPYALYADSTGSDQDWSVNGDHMYAATSGNVGVGTETPGKKLTVIKKIRSAYDENQSDYLDLIHGPGNGLIYWAGSGHLDFRYEENTNLTLMQDGRMVLGDPGPNMCSLLQLNSTDKGFRLPRMSAAEISAIVDPKYGLMVYNKEDEHIYVFRENNGNIWQRITSLSTVITPCPPSIVDPRNGLEYNTRAIGTQCWMTENINIGNMINSAQNQANNGIIEKYCYDNDPNNCEEYGGLYMWDEMMEYVTLPGTKGICPDGWHIPTDDEWCTLELFVDPTIDCNGYEYRGLDGGGKLKEAGTTHWFSPNTGATDQYGFKALPCGYWDDVNGGFEKLGMQGHHWSSTENSGGSGAYYRSFSFNTAKIYRGSPVKSSGIGVRCVRN